LKATAVLPVKRFGAAKQRLASGIGRNRRADLVAAMLEDVLEAISGTRSVERMIVVTSEPRAEDLALATGAELLPDPDEGGHSGAALAGIARALELGATCAVLLPGDCPLLDPRELERLLTGMPERYVTVVPDRHGTGTNALALAPPDAIEPAFGEGSPVSSRHAAVAPRGPPGLSAYERRGARIASPPGPRPARDRGRSEPRRDDLRPGRTA